MVDSSTFPPTIDYMLTVEGARLLPALDILYVWSIRQMAAKDIPIDADNFVVHKSEKYVEALRDIMEANSFWPDTDHVRCPKSKRP